MPTYNWEGKLKTGEVKKGELVADTVSIARIQLRKLRIVAHPDSGEKRPGRGPLFFPPPDSRKKHRRFSPASLPR